ncbi:hypothetical protein P4493_04695 [Bacillus thuringiensis]|uniref:Uncharacterized protein n=3 Tax=Bacillus thuringiensis TaxID=1428 RepID=A0A0B5NII1_BACTU|nr:MULTISPECIES: hypothetical protein [Bacillus]EAO56883.1 hypothetical protein RBTH_07613 [Bacillus thuringiensis serovar israelensis ATCC 35646]MEC2535868.1 hypothetical protein [Bacillus cereus]MED1153709.1 hypothetical protein [Bacillus paranthracis]OUB09418.1 hypothetical protein BK708_33395 [Bacillus thuringiensis serovar yunnanensis]AFQ30029.1 hypothetical protein BTF1_29642 [Bacillus thuringiensis HD-789]
MLLTVEQLVGSKNELEATTLDLGEVNKFTGSKELNDLLFSSLQNIFTKNGVIDTVTSKKEEVLDYRTRATNRFVLRVDKEQFETKSAIFVTDEHVIKNDKAKEKQHTGKEIEYNILTLIKKYEDMFDIKQLSDQEYRLISILNVIMLTEASFVVFGMEATDMHENLLLMIEDYKENSLNCKLETIIFYENEDNRIAYGGINEFSTHKVKSPNQYEKFYKSV